MIGRRVVILLVVGVLSGTGCNRQDADCLARIGHLLTQRAQALKTKSTAKTGLTHAIPDLLIPEDRTGSEPEKEKGDQSGPPSLRQP